MKQRTVALLCTAAMLASLTGCSAASGETDYSNQTITGQVTAIDGSTVTLQLGELTEQEMGEMPNSEQPDGEQSDGEQPNDEAASSEQSNDETSSTEQTKDEQSSGEKPNGEQPGKGQPSGEKPSGEKPSGEKPSGGKPEDGQTPPEKPKDAASDSSQDAQDSTDSENDTQTPPEKPEDGEKPTDEKSDGEKPDTEQSDGDQPDEEMPENDGQQDGEKPDGEKPSGDLTMYTFTAGEETLTIDLDTLDLDSAEISIESMMETTEGTLDDIEVDDVLVIEVGDDNAITGITVKFVGGDMPDGEGGQGENGQGQGGGFGGSGEVTQGTAATTIDEDGEYADTTYTSEGDDENALRVDGAEVTLTEITVDKSAGASSNTEDGDFYGMNAALLATNGATVTIKNATVTSSAQNGNGVFGYGSGTTVNISDSTITTTADNSGGIQTTGGAVTNASNLTVETSGNSSAAIRSDRGGGTVNVDGGTYTSKGYNSPAVYSTAVITVKNAVLTAMNSEALVIEGENSITLEDCDVTGNMSDTEGTSSDENVHNVMIYQSMSGDANVGTSSFSMTGGSLTARNGDMIYVTNTHCTIFLSDVDIVNEDSDGYLLRVSGNSASHGWGTAGANGGQVDFTASSQTLEGDIIVDTISTLNLTLSDGSTFTGTINIVDNEEGGTAVEDNAAVTIDEGCTWTLTGDCTLTFLENNGTINYNGYTITLADGTVLQ